MVDVPKNTALTLEETKIIHGMAIRFIWNFSRFSLIRPEDRAKEILRSLSTKKDIAETILNNEIISDPSIILEPRKVKQIIDKHQFGTSVDQTDLLTASESVGKKQYMPDSEINRLLKSMADSRILQPEKRVARPGRPKKTDYEKIGRPAALYSPSDELKNYSAIIQKHDAQILFRVLATPEITQLYLEYSAKVTMHTLRGTENHVEVIKKAFPMMPLNESFLAQWQKRVKLLNDEQISAEARRWAQEQMSKNDNFDMTLLFGVLPPPTF